MLKIAENSQKTCKHCGKGIQYVTNDHQEYCSNTCRSHANQARKAAKVEVSQLRKATAELANKAKDNVKSSAESMTSEQLWKLVEAMMTELAAEKAKNALLSKEVAKFRKVAFNLYVTNE